MKSLLNFIRRLRLKRIRIEMHDARFSGNTKRYLSLFATYSKLRNQLDKG